MKLLNTVFSFVLACVLASTASAALPATDLFNTADGALGAGGDTTWAYNRNNAVNLTISTDVANHYVHTSDTTADTAAHWTGDTFGTNHCSATVYYTISTNGAGVGQGYGPAVRMDTATTQKTFVRFIGDSHGWTIDRCNNAVCTTGLVTSAVAIAIADTVEMCVTRSGSNDIYSFTKNGTALPGSPYTDASPLSAFLGSGIAHSSTTTASTTGLDSWSGRNLGGRPLATFFFN